MDTSDIAAVTRNLKKRRVTLQDDLERLSAPPEEGAAVGFGKRIGDGTSEAVERISSTATSRSLAASITSIDEALDRIAEGRYGFCDRCGEAISAERLEALPSASLCFDCASI